jgi:hypothetical protein
MILSVRKKGVVEAKTWEMQAFESGGTKPGLTSFLYSGVYLVEMDSVD